MGDKIESRKLVSKIGLNPVPGQLKPSRFQRDALKDAESFGYPVAFTLDGLSVIVGFFALGPNFFNFLPSRIMGVMSNYVLMAVPLFIYMGIMLEKSGLAEAPGRNTSNSKTMKTQQHNT